MRDCRAMTQTISIAMMAAQSLPDVAVAPEWIHLLPAGGKPIATRDGRGPYQFADAASLMADSLADFDRLPLDENHATDIAAPLGQSAPARGWIVALQARADGIWVKSNGRRPGANSSRATPTATSVPSSATAPTARSPASCGLPSSTDPICAA